jgi:hypothetical protein
MAGTDEHIKLLHLFDLARDSKSTEEELKHIRECEECQRVREVFARQFGKPASNKPEDATKGAKPTT